MNFCCTYAVAIVRILHINIHLHQVHQPLKWQHIQPECLYTRKTIIVHVNSLNKTLYESKVSIHKIAVWEKKQSKSCMNVSSRNNVTEKYQHCCCGCKFRHHILQFFLKTGLQMLATLLSSKTYWKPQNITKVWHQYRPPPCMDEYTTNLQYSSIDQCVICMANKVP